MMSMNTLYAVAILAGIASATLGGFNVCAASMSDAPSEGEKAGKKGLVAALIGLVLIVAGIVGLIL